VIVAASTDCFSELSFDDALEKLVDLQFSNVEVVIRESGGQLKPSQVLQNLEDVIDICRSPRRMTVCSYTLEIDATGEAYYDHFKACCRLAKATKVVSLTVPSAELGTPFNEEVEHLRRLVAIAELEGSLVSIKSQVGRLSQDPDTVMVLCNNVKGLGVTLDPSHYICGPLQGGSYDQILSSVYHVQLRDTSKETLQVRIGKGEVEYGRLLGALRKVKYKRAVCVHMQELPDLDHMAEMRKMRLLLESLV